MWMSKGWNKDSKIIRSWVMLLSKLGQGQADEEEGVDRRSLQVRRNQTGLALYKKRMLNKKKLAPAPLGAQNGATSSGRDNLCFSIATPEWLKESEEEEAEEGTQPGDHIMTPRNIYQTEVVAVNASNAEEDLLADPERVKNLIFKGIEEWRQDSDLRMEEDGHVPLEGEDMQGTEELEANEDTKEIMDEDKTVDVEEGEKMKNPYGRLKPAPEKRRTLGVLDPNGCRKAHGSYISTEENTGRDMKNRDDGLSQNKARAVKTWLNRYVRTAKVIGLQEVKSCKWHTARWLPSVKKRGHVIFDPPVGKKGGTALILHPGMAILSSGTGGNGRMAWAITRNGEEVVGFISIHTPNRRNQRMEFWQKIQDIIQEGQWMILGDYNQVELGDDARGKSSLIRGREERIWRIMAAQYGLVDAYLCAGNVEGVRFTRMARSESRYDCSRLDRFYLTRGGSWVGRVCEVKHFHSSSLSDHVLEVRNDQEKNKAFGNNLESEVEWRRGQISDTSNEQEHTSLAEAERKLREKQLREAWVWRLRSRKRWLTEDDAPARYFFAKLTTKWQREAMEALETTDGELVTDRDEILAEIHEFYQDLYTEEEESDSRRGARDELASLIQKSLPSEESTQISRMPDKMEIEDVVQKMKTNKAPRIDGLTIEVLKSCWDFSWRRLCADGLCCVGKKKAT
ncbi:hypothetical protein R1sor_001022 [Riccia sorocarpa]|uniref:Endonuclease/exonuclease/phosphatase domain-containing protein n=1 Tax=Riccia sorocarpa TaxID=122646 RepID=A0ABD3GXY0_9MARC